LDAGHRPGRSQDLGCGGLNVLFERRAEGNWNVERRQTSNRCEEITVSVLGDSGRDLRTNSTAQMTLIDH
jgi:hypothetical protein